MAKYTIALCFNRILEWVKDFWNLFVRQKSRKIFRSRKCEVNNLDKKNVQKLTILDEPREGNSAQH